MTAEADGVEVMFISPGTSIRLGDSRLVAVVEGMELEIRTVTSAHVIARSLPWDGVGRVGGLSGERVQTVAIDPRIAAGLTPDHAGWWHLLAARDGIELAELGGPRAYSKHIIGCVSKSFGLAAYAAAADGRGRHAALIGAVTQAGLLEPDVGARLLRSSAGRPAARWWQPVPTEAFEPLVRLLEVVPAPRRERIVDQLLQRVPDGVTPELAAEMAEDDALAGWLVEQGTWPVVSSALLRRQERGLPVECFARALRRRGILGACANGNEDALSAALVVEELADRALDALESWLTGLLAHRLPDARGLGLAYLTMLVDRRLDTVWSFLSRAVVDEESSVLAECAPVIGRIAASDPARAIEMATSIFIDSGLSARRAIADQLSCLIAAGGEGAIGLATIAVTDHVSGVRKAVVDQISLVRASGAPCLDHRVLIGVLDVAAGDATSDVRQAAMSAVAGFGPSPTTLAILRRGLGDPAGKVRSEAFQQLVNLSASGSADVVELFRWAVSDGRGAHLLSLHQLAEHEGIETSALFDECRRQATEGSVTARRAVAVSLAALIRRCGLASVEELVRLSVGSAHDTVAVAAAESMVSMAWHEPADARRLLEIGISSPSVAARATLFGRLAAFCESDVLGLDDLIGLLQREPTSAVREGAASGLHEILRARPEWAEGLIEALICEENGCIRAAAIGALGASEVNIDLAIRLIRQVLVGASHDVRMSALSAIERLAKRHPSRAAELMLEAKSAGLCLDIEVQISLATAGVPIVDPLVESLGNCWTAVSKSPGLLASLATANSADDVLDVAVRFEYPAPILVALDGHVVDTAVGEVRSQVIQSLRSLRQNADEMRNCTAGYANQLFLGDVMVAFHDGSGRPLYNGHLARVEGTWRVMQVNGVQNQWNAGISDVLSWLEAQCDVLPATRTAE